MTAGSGARIAVACGAAGFPLLLLSYSWIPFAAAGREMGGWIALVVVGEGGALLAAAAAIGLGWRARQASAGGTPAHRLASRGVALGILLLVLVTVPNLAGVLLFGG